MAAVAYTVAAATGVPDVSVGGLKVRVRDVTATTGDYAAGGTTITASSLGLKRIYCVVAQDATSGTAGATLNPVGVRYAAGGASITLQTYEAAATGLILLEKTNSEAMAANWTTRVFAIGV
jgi:hypothetical protein